MWKRLKNQKGLTLLEVLVALACASLAIVSFVTLTSFSTEMEADAKRLTEATLIAENMMRSIEEGDFPETGMEEGEVEGMEGFTYKKHVTDTFIENVKEIRLEIFWDQGKRGTEFLLFVRKK
jgi:type II secretion system protein I